ncbi:2-keto-4-pentenoate hydratase [Nocardia nova]|uniref:2-keto-4-pentenoate hydratase n=2 Tax=Nocardia nova TaxID=37330 RepID=A0A2S6A2B9_9NOCA|nr:2-keto-4-pentenoate hydratase [Nocardia nova]
MDTAVDRLITAERTRTPCAPVRDLVGAGDVDIAYRVQQGVVDHRRRGGSVVVGRKIGLTSAAVQRQLGVDRPDFGVLFDDMDVSGLDTVPIGRLLQPRVEAEVAFVLGADLAGDDLGLSAVRAAVEYATAALEIVDSRIANWDITIGDTIADNASSGLFVLGDRKVSLAEFEPVNVAMTMQLDGAAASAGTGADCLGDPMIALLWLARTAQAFGEPLRAGQVVLSGALGPMAVVRPGTTVRAEISALGEVVADFGVESEGIGDH